MPCASDRKFSKTFIGDFTFDIERDRTRYPLFLHRNIMRVLKHHAKRRKPNLRPSTTSRNDAPKRPSQLDLVTPPPRSTRLRDQLIEKFHQEDAELIFDVRSIRRKLNYRENLEDRPRKRIKREAVECRCYLAVWDNREGHRQLEPILKRSAGCVVAPADTSDNHAVEIELESPFRIPAAEFFVPILKDGEITKWAIGDRYLLEIKIIPCKRAERWPPMPILSKSEESLARALVKREELAFTEGMLISNYTNLPHAPPAGVPLNVAFDQGGRTFKTKYGLQVNAEWTYPHVYVAKIKKGEEVLAGRLEEDERTDPLCLSVGHGRNGKRWTSKVPGVHEQSLVQPCVKISYIWDIETKTPISTESRTISLEGLYCPVCHIREFSNLKHLQFHFTTSHDKYRFSIESQQHDQKTNRLACVIFRVQSTETIKARAANNVKDEREFSWQRPRRPFDIDAYIDGEQSWVGALPRRRTAVAATAQSVPSQLKNTSTTALAAGLAVRKDLFRPAAQVLDVPLRTRKKFQVPLARTRKKTSFYRSINHRTMKTGDVLSETDDDVDDRWLIKRHGDVVLETEGLTELEKNFRLRWNAHIMSEGCPSARYVSDSLVRFVRSNVAWLKGRDGDVDMFVEFQELTSLLMERNFIDTRIIKDCLQIIRDGDEVDGKQMSGLKTDGTSPCLQKEEPTISEDSSGNHEAEAEAGDLSLQNQGKPAERGERDHVEADSASHQIPNGDKHVAASPSEKHTGSSTAEASSEAGSLDNIQQPSIFSKTESLPHMVAHGFCATCKKYINRPKRNAITCSDSKCESRGIFHHLSCLGLDLKISQVERRMFRCKDCSLKPAPS